MITEQALQEAIAECQGNKNPNRETCMMLAAFYTIQDHLYPHVTDPPAYSYAPGPAEQVSYDSGTEFSDALKGRDLDEIMPVLDDMMDAVKTMLPRLYDGIMKRLRD